MPDSLADKDATALAFLSRVLPAGGYYYAFVEHRSMQIPCESIDELWSVMKAQKGNCWFASAAFCDNTSRKVANIRTKQALYIDLDYGEDKAVATVQEAAASLKPFLKKAKLPYPIVNHTGHGFHFWWPLLEPLSYQAWHRLALGLKGACIEHRFPVHKDDLGVIADGARLMRCPGLTNYGGPNKPGPPKPVIVASDFRGFGPYRLNDFAHLLENTIVAFPEPEGDGRTILTEVTRTRVRSALAFINEKKPELRDQRDTWFRIGAAIFELGWGDEGLYLWTEWSYKSPKFDPAAQVKTWRSFARGYEGVRVTAGTLFGLAKDLGWVDPFMVEPLSFVTEHGLYWETNKVGQKKPTLENAIQALSVLGVKARKNKFTGITLVRFPCRYWAAEEHSFSDQMIIAIRGAILETFKFDATVAHVDHAVEHLAESCAFDPLRDYLRELKWDKVARIDRWLNTYMHAEDNDLNRAIGRLTLVAAVRRGLEPGIKFDHMLILAGRQGCGKSTAVRIMGRDTFFSDQHIIVEDSRTVAEAMQGTWLYEWSELAGFNSARSIERLKAVVAGQVDKARMAYDRKVTIMPRRAILVGTTNDYDVPLFRDRTGARRFLPVIVDDIDTDGLERDMDQLYAEAMVAAKTYGALVLPYEVRRAALALQNDYTAPLDYEDALAELIGQPYRMEDGKTGEKLLPLQIYTYLEIPPERQTRSVRINLNHTMIKLGWVYKTIRMDDKRTMGWTRDIL